MNASDEQAIKPNPLESSIEQNRSPDVKKPTGRKTEDKDKSSGRKSKARARPSDGGNGDLSIGTGSQQSVD